MLGNSLITTNSLSYKEILPDPLGPFVKAYYDDKENLYFHKAFKIYCYETEKSGHLLWGRNGKLTWPSSVKYWQLRQNKEKLVQHHAQNSEIKNPNPMLNKQCLGIVVSAVGVRSQGSQETTNREHLYSAAVLFNLTSLHIHSRTFNQMLPWTAALKHKPVVLLYPDRWTRFARAITL